jgi:hypothetical protein
MEADATLLEKVCHFILNGFKLAGNGGIPWELKVAELRILIYLLPMWRNWQTR